MSTENPSPRSDGDHGQNSTVRAHRHLDCDVVARDSQHERITDVRDLDVGDRVLVGGRQKPLTVRDHGTRTQELCRGDPTQHAVEVSGDWADAAPHVLINVIRLDGTRPGRISVDERTPEPVWRVER